MVSAEACPAAREDKGDDITALDDGRDDRTGVER